MEMEMEMGMYGQCFDGNGAPKSAHATFHMASQWSRGDDLDCQHSKMQNTTNYLGAEGILNPNIRRPRCILGDRD